MRAGERPNSASDRRGERRREEKKKGGALGLRREGVCRVGAGSARGSRETRFKALTLQIPKPCLLPAVRRLDQVGTPRFTTLSEEGALVDTHSCVKASTPTER